MNSADLLFVLVLGSMLVHEIDAYRAKEWRMLPVLDKLSDATARRIFIWLHLPLLVIFFLLLFGSFSGIFKSIFASFAIMHLGLHILYLSHPANQFSSRSSWSVIVATAFFGVLYLAVDLFTR